MSAFGVRADIVIDDFNRNNRPSSRVYRPLEIRVNITSGTRRMPKGCTARRARNSGRIANELVAKRGERGRQVHADVL